MSINSGNRFLLQIINIILGFMLISCKVQNTSLTSFATSSPSATVSPTQIIPTNTQQNLIDLVENRCAKTVPVEQLLPEISDVILSYSIDPYLVYLSDPLIINKKELRFDAGLAPYGMLTSPDRKLAAMTMSPIEPPSRTTKLIIFDAAGTTKKEFVWKSEWGRLAAWLDNHRILIARQADLQLSIYNPETVILLDINTGEDTEIQVTYPDLNHVEYVNWNLINYIYSPDLTRVLYPTSRVDPGYVNYVALWDMENKQILATLPLELPETSLPQWSPDGSQVLVSGLVSKPGENATAWRRHELFAIDRNGNIAQLTHFTDYYPGTITIEDYTWSPDGQNIAFWLQTKQMAEPQLFTFNVSSGKSINHCIFALPFHGASRPIWSPLGDYLMIDRQESAKAVPQTLLLDILQGTVTQIAEDIYVVDWLVSP
jgi:hypothetical protein